MSNYYIFRITQSCAKYFINENHRHLNAPVGWKFGFGAVKNEHKNRPLCKHVLGVVWVGRTIARNLPDKTYLEINRLCVLEKNKNLCSQLISKAIKFIQKTYKEKRYLITYLKKSELATVFKAVNFYFYGFTQGGYWRGRDYQQPKQRWIYFLNNKEKRKIRNLLNKKKKEN